MNVCTEYGDDTAPLRTKREGTHELLLATNLRRIRTRSPSLTVLEVGGTKQSR